MKTVIFVMILVWSGGQLPTHEEPMELDACLKRVESSLKDFMEIDETFRYVAACRIVSKKSDPA